MKQPKLSPGTRRNALLRRSIPTALLPAVLTLALAGYAGGVRSAAQEPAPAKSPEQKTAKVLSAAPAPVEKTSPAPPAQGTQPPAQGTVVAPTGPQPAVSVKGEASFNFGEVWPSDAIKHSFTLSNTGQAELSILKVQPG